MKTISCLLLAVLPWLSAIRADAQEEQDLAELAASKRGAALRLSIPLAPDSVGSDTGSVFGVFISDDGLALVSLLALGKAKQPKVFAADGTPLEFGSVLGLFPEQTLALIKFEHRPKVGCSLARKEPDVGKTVALVTLNNVDMLDGEVPPITGPVMAKRHNTTSDLRETRFVRVMSLGSGFSTQQGTWVHAGCFVTDHEGDLVAFLGKGDRLGTQFLIELFPVVSLADSIDRLAEDDAVIPFPLPESRYPLDTAVLDGDWRPMMLALQRGDRAQMQRLHKELLERHPNSITLKLKSVSPGFVDPANPLGALADVPESDASLSAAQQVERLMARAVLQAAAKDYEGAIRDFKMAVALSPEDFPLPRFNLAIVYLEVGLFDDAERLFREAYQSWPECIELVEKLESVLIRQGKIKEAIVMAKRINELRAIYKVR